jgi:hypothetical protein
MDFERVYTSDMKKMVNWSVALQKHDIDYTPSEQPEEEDEVTAEADSAEKTAEAPKKGGRKKNVAETLEAAGEKVVLDVSADEVPEVAKTKTTRSRKKKTDDENS